jgi:hypothetical protein
MVELSLELLFEDDTFQIELDKEAGIIQLTFRKQPDTDHFRNGYRLAIDTALRKEVKYWLTDAQQIKVMLPENQGWLKQNMGPLLKPALVRKFAIVMAPECFVMTNPNQVYNQANPGPATPDAGRIKVHFEKEAAYEWLFSGEAS